VDRAYIFSARVHDGQVRLSGEPYLSHPLEVAYILAELKLDGISVASGLLHDVVEDTHATSEEIEKMFGPQVTHIVSGVTKLSKLSFSDSHARQAENMRKMILAMADDIRVVLIKLADRLHNMRTLQFHKEHKRRKIAKETLDIYAPIAGRLGIQDIKRQLENVAFKYLHPDQYEEIERRINRDRDEREKYISRVKKIIDEKMEETGIDCEVLGRHKHYYSVYRKMLTQDLAYDEVYDIIAFRIIMDKVSQCYEVLGLLHALWKPIPQKFKDYIGFPKANMYQSLHTTVIGPSGERVEIQIRTKEMDKVAKSGIAAHWSYKEGKSIDEKTGQTFAWIRNLVENQENIKDPDEFMESVRIDLFPDEAYVFTPHGDIKSLPKGATPVDFAYHIHTEVGNRCVGAKVNGRIVNLSAELNTGDIVEIITSKNHQPSKDWLNFVKTVKARSRIRQHIKVQEKGRSITLGREMCEKAFRKNRMNFNALLRSEEMEKAVKDFGFKTAEDLIADVGYGKITSLQVLHKFIPKPEPEDTDKSILGRLIGRKSKKKSPEGVIVKGVDDVLVKFGKCCQPVPGDSITGYITRGFGVTIHRVNCINALKMSPERRVDVNWDQDLSETYPVKVKVCSHDKVGLLADITASISKNGANIIHANTDTHENMMVDTFFTITVKSTSHLIEVINAIKKVKNVIEVKRLTS
jgi:GTP pyrophosphokinase